VPPPEVVPPSTTVGWTILRSRENKVRSLTVEEGAVRSGDKIRFSCKFSRPKYAFLFWISSEGSVERIFPPDPLGANKMTVEIQWPSDDPLDARMIEGPPGTEVLLLVLLDEPSDVPMTTAFRRAITPDQCLRERAGSPLLIDGVPLQHDQREIGRRTTLVEIPDSIERLWRTARKSVSEIQPRAHVHMVALSHEP
jgi:hypothetical protein